jgi:hypothetical protein
MTNRQEVKVQTRGPDGGNSTPTRQGRWPEHRALAVGLRHGEPVRGRVVEVIGARPFRAQAKHREASAAGELAPSNEARSPSVAARVRVTGWSRSRSVLPKEICWVPHRW